MHVTYASVVFVPLVDVGPGEGVTEFLQGSHISTDGPLGRMGAGKAPAQRPGQDEIKVEGHQAAVAATISGTPGTVHAGSAIVFDGRLFHRGEERRRGSSVASNAS